MLIPSITVKRRTETTSLSRGMNANSQLYAAYMPGVNKSIKRDEC